MIIIFKLKLKLACLSFSHFLHRFLDGKKTTRSQFCVPGLREIHRNLKQEKNFNSRESFFRKSPFCTFSCINPGFGGPLDKLWIFFLVAMFIMLEKNAFGQKNFWISCTGSKVPFWQFFNFAKMALLNLCMKFKFFFWPKAFFWSIIKMAIRKSRIYAGKSTQRGISKKRTHENWNFFLVLGSYESLKILEH